MANDPPITEDLWQRIQSLFLETAELPDSDRASFLKQQGEEEFIIQQVQSLLDHDAGELIVGQAPTSHEIPLRHPGQSIGKYVLTFPISLQASSEVWCARDSVANSTDSKERVAIKFLKCDPGSTQQQKLRLIRFAREATFLRKFQHTGIAGFLDCGQTEFHEPYIVMQYVDGLPITEYADKHQLITNDRIRLAIQVCKAVGYAHQHLVVHRDLKPANIMVDQKGNVVVLDFGICHPLTSSDRKHAADSVQVNLTSTDERPMTPAWASPEQLAGESITTATDIHAIGLVLYELLTGHHPFSPTAHPDCQSLYERVSRSTPRLPHEIVGFPSKPLTDLVDRSSNIAKKDTSAIQPSLIAAHRGANPRQLRRKLKGRVGSVVLKALSKDPNDRYRSVSELQTDLLALVDGGPVIAAVQRKGIADHIRQQPIRFVVATILGGILLNVLTSFWVASIRDERLNDVSSQMQSDLDRTKSETRRIDEQLVGLKEVLSSSEHSSSYVDALDPKARTNIAKLAARSGDYRLASDTVLPVENVSRQQFSIRIDTSEIYSRLGRPAAANESLIGRDSLLKLVELTSNQSKASVNANHSGERAKPVIKTILKELQYDNRAIELLVQNLLDSGLADAASAISNHAWDATAASQLETNSLLLMARARLEIGWTEGASQLIEEIENEESRFPIDQRQSLQLRVLKTQLIEDARQRLDAISMLNESHSVDRISPNPYIRLITQKAILLDDLGQSNEAYGELRRLIESVNQADYGIRIDVLEAELTLAKQMENQLQFRLSMQQIERGAPSEFGTKTVVEFSIEKMRSAKSPDEIIAIYEILKPFAAIWESNDYQHRWILRFTLEAAIKKQEWQQALQILRRLTEIEQELWDAPSMEVAYAEASLAFVSDKLGDNDSAKTHLQSTRQIAIELHEAAPDELASTFLIPVCQTLPPIASRDWLHLWMMHRGNSKEIQFEMLVFTIEQHMESDSQTIEPLVNALLKRDDLFEDSAGANAFRCLRLLRAAMKFGLNELVKERLPKFVNSTNNDVSKEASAIFGR